MSHGILSVVVALLAVSVVLVPLAQRLGLGSVMGYLAAGMLVGPWGAKLIDNVDDIMHFSEMGVVLFLFLIGLEVEMKKLLALRNKIFGLGGLQVLITTGIIAVALFASHLGWVTASIAGMGFALSSTAIALQLLKERNLMPTVTGQSAFSILLFQDIAVIPMLAILPLLGAQQSASGSAWFTLFKIVSVLVAVVIIGRLALRHILRMVAQSHLREVFTALSLLLVLAMAWLMTFLGLSMGLGAFLAGMLLADSEYRHAVETDIEPFKGLLLGLFFMSVGMSINFGYIEANPTWIAAIVLGTVAVKCLVLYILGCFFGIPKRQRLFFALVLSQVGEFAFVLFGTAQGLKLIETDTTGGLMAVVALSMLTTPVLIFVYEKWLEDRFFPGEVIDDDVIENESNPVIIAGFGRFGQIIGRLLYANQITATVLDHEPSQIELLRRFNFKVYYGDATRLDLIHSAGAEQAKILVVAIDDIADSLALVDLARQHFPHLKIFARARNVAHYYDLLDRQVSVIEREMFEGSLRLGVEVLRELGWPAYRAVVASMIFRKHNLNMLTQMHPLRKNEKATVSVATQAREDLEKMFVNERKLRTRTEQEW